MHLFVSAWTPVGGSHAGRAVTRNRRRRTIWGAVLCLEAALALGGCDYVNNALWPSLTGPSPTGNSQTGDNRPTHAVAGDTSVSAINSSLASSRAPDTSSAPATAQAPSPSPAQAP